MRRSGSEAYAVSGTTGHEINRAIEVRKASAIKTPDAIVAGTALLMKARLVTRNTADFKRVSGLELVNPFEPDAIIEHA